MNIWICHIDHKHGEDYTAHLTEEQAWHTAYAYAKEWWSEYVEDPETPEDSELVDAVNLYFERSSASIDGEYLTIKQLPLAMSNRITADNGNAETEDFTRFSELSFSWRTCYTEVRRKCHAS